MESAADRSDRDQQSHRTEHERVTPVQHVSTSLSCRRTRANRRPLAHCQQPGLRVIPLPGETGAPARPGANPFSSTNPEGEAYASPSGFPLARAPRTRATQPRLYGGDGGCGVDGLVAFGVGV